MTLQIIRIGTGYYLRRRTLLFWVYWREGRFNYFRRDAFRFDTYADARLQFDAELPDHDPVSIEDSVRL